MVREVNGILRNKQAALTSYRNPIGKALKNNGPFLARRRLHDWRVRIVSFS